MSVNQQDAMLRLSYLLGEASIPTSGVDSRRAFVQDTLDEIYKAYPWEWAMTVATISLANGVATMPSGRLEDGPLDVREVSSGTLDDNVYTQTDYEAADSYIQGQYRYWLVGNELRSPEDDTTLTVRYQTAAPSINASISTPFNDANTIALGALRFVRISENPFADISQEEQNFQAHLEKHIAMANRNNARTRRSSHSISGYSTGDV